MNKINRAQNSSFLKLLFFTIFVFIPLRSWAKKACLESLFDAPFVSLVETPRDALQLLDDHRSALTQRVSAPAVGAKQVFLGVAGKDVYNPTKPFWMNGEEVLAARVESRNSESDSKVVFFRRKGKETWEPIVNAPIFKMQDPFVSEINGLQVIGGVETYHRPDGTLGYKTIFYSGTTFNNLERIAEGPAGMKDIRLIQVRENGKIYVFTRPQGEVGGRGKIGLTEINNMSELTPELIQSAPLLEQQFAQEEWGGANEIQVLNNGKLGVLGHVARFDAQGGRHYYPAVFAFDPSDNTYSPLKIILERSELPHGQSKRKDLQDVLFSGGLRRMYGNMAELFAGAGDAETYRVTLSDPFSEYE